ncbi:MAG TPA: hypothetical protein VMG12_38435 [Polyangiaceae bacterium]|nr:hypothetical protein [Polyangiaceae bacterium]
MGPASRVLREGASFGPASRRQQQEASSQGPASRMLDGATSMGPASRVLDNASSLGPASRVLDNASSLGPASRVVAEGSGGAVSRTPPDAPRTGRTQPYELLHQGDTDLVACVGPCLVVVSHMLAPEAVDAMGRGMAKLEHRYGKLSSISFVERKSGPNTAPETRDGIAEIVRKHAHCITGAAVVCEGTGFRATAIRSVVTAIHMASRSSHSSKVFAAPEAAVEWLASTRTDGAIDIKLLLEATTVLRAKVQAQLARAAAREPW